MHPLEKMPAQTNLSFCFMTGPPTPPLTYPLRNKGLYNKALLRETNGFS